MKNTPLSLLALALIASAAVAQTATAPKLKMTESAGFEWKDLKVEPRPNGERRAVFDNPTVTLANLECHVTTLKVGESSGAAHTHDTNGLVEEVTVLKEGTIEIAMNERKQKLGPGSVFYFAPKDRVEIRNLGATPATYVVISIRATPPAAKN